MSKQGTTVVLTDAEIEILIYAIAELGNGGDLGDEDAENLNSAETKIRSARRHRSTWR